MKRTNNQISVQDADGGGAQMRPLLRASRREADEEEQAVARMLVDLTDDSEVSEFGGAAEIQETYKEVFGDAKRAAGRCDTIVATAHCEYEHKGGERIVIDIDWANIYSQSVHEDGSKLFKYVTAFYEEGKAGNTPHWHVWAQLTRKVQLGVRKKNFISNQMTLNAAPQAKGGSLMYGCKHMWVEAAAAGVDAIAKYCEKEGLGIRVECGVYDAKQGQQGKNANQNIMNMIDEGASTLEIWRAFPDQAARMHKMIDRAVEERDRKLFRTEQTKGIFYWGATATGKSYRAYGPPGFWNPDIHFAKTFSTNDKGSWRWWCGFSPSTEVVVLDEIRSGVPFREMLAMADKTPHSVEVKYGGKVNFRPKLVIATAPMHPREIWEHSLGDQEGWDQFTRRWRIIRCFKGGVDGKQYLQEEDGGEPEAFQCPHHPYAFEL